MLTMIGSSSRVRENLLRSTPLSLPKGPKRQDNKIHKPARPRLRISCLKILTKALLRQIEELETSKDDDPEEGFDLREQVQKFEAALIRSALITTGGRQRPAARLLRTRVTTLHTKIRHYQIKIEPEPQSGDSNTSNPLNHPN